MTARPAAAAVLVVLALASPAVAHAAPRIPIPECWDYSISAPNWWNTSDQLEPCSGPGWLEQQAESAIPLPPPAAAIPAVNADTLAQNVSDAAAEHVRRPESVTCPTGLQGIVGTSTRCTITDKGATFGAVVTVTDVEGLHIGLHYQFDAGWPN